MCEFQVRLLLLWHKAFPGSSLSTVKGTGPENYIFKGYWVSLESSIMPVFSAEPKLFLTEFGTDHVLDSFKSIFFPHNRTTLTFLRCSHASGTLVTLTTWSWETTLSEWYGDITPTKDPPRQWGKILILCQPSHSSIPTLLYSPWKKCQKSPESQKSSIWDELEWGGGYYSVAGGGLLAFLLTYIILRQLLQHKSQ